MKKKIDQFFLN